VIATRAYQLSDAERERTERIDQLVVRADVDGLIASVSDSSWTVRRAAVAGLASLGDTAVPQLRMWLCDKRTGETEIAAVVDSLVASSGASIDPAMIELLAHPRPDIAADAAQILGRRRASSGVPALCRAVEHANDNVAIAAIEALGLIGGSSGMTALLPAARSGNFFRVFAAVQVLARLDDPRGIAPIAHLLHDPSFRSVAISALGQTGSAQAVAALASLLPDADDDETRLVARALGDLIARAEWNGSAAQVEVVMRDALAPWAARLTAVLANAGEDDAKRILDVLGRIGGMTQLEVLASQRDRLAEHAKTAIQRIARRHEDALPQVLADAEPNVLAALLPVVSSRRCAPAVRELLSDDDDAIRALACHTLARIGDIAAVPLLFAALENPGPHVALAATAAIQSLGAADTEARTIRLLREGSPAARRHALRIVSYMGFKNAFDVVHEATHDPDPRIAELAITTLGTLDLPAVDEVLAGLTAPGQRAAAIRALSHRTSDLAFTLLLRGVDDELPWVRYYACQGLGRVGRTEAIAALVGRLRDEVPHVRLAALEALAQFDVPAAWNALLGAAISTDPDEVRTALLGIGLHPRPLALPILLGASRSPDVATQLIALAGLARHTDRAALDSIAAAASRERPEVRDAAVSLLAERPDRQAADVLVELAIQAAETHPAHAALSRPSRERIDAIYARCERADERAAITLIAALARMHHPLATDALYRLVGVPNSVTRRVAAVALVRTGQPRALDIVARMSREDPDPAVRHVCLAAGESGR
jgi:HEAT repeat protein